MLPAMVNIKEYTKKGSCRPPFLMIFSKQPNGILNQHGVRKDKVEWCHSCSPLVASPLRKF